MKVILEKDDNKIDAIAKLFKFGRVGSYEYLQTKMDLIIWISKIDKHHKKQANEK